VVPSGSVASSTWRKTPSITPRQWPSASAQIAVGGGQLREIWNAKNLATAEAELKALVEAYRKSAPELAAWLEVAVPEGLAVFTLPEHHRKRMRTSNPIERAVQQELKRRTVKVRVFPNNTSLLRLVTAVLVEIDETWLASTQPYINWNTPDA